MPSPSGDKSNSKKKKKKKRKRRESRKAQERERDDDCANMLQRQREERKHNSLNGISSMILTRADYLPTHICTAKKKKKARSSFDCLAAQLERSINKKKKKLSLLFHFLMALKGQKKNPTLTNYGLSFSFFFLSFFQSRQTTISHLSFLFFPPPPPPFLSVCCVCILCVCVGAYIPTCIQKKNKNKKG